LEQLKPPEPVPQVDLEKEREIHTIGELKAYIDQAMCQGATVKSPVYFGGCAECDGCDLHFPTIHSNNDDDPIFIVIDREPGGCPLAPWQDQRSNC